MCLCMSFRNSAHPNAMLRYSTCGTWPNDMVVALDKHSTVKRVVRTVCTLYN